MGKIDFSKSLPDERLVKLRHGMKMVLEDRIQRFNETDDMSPLFDTLNSINSDYAPNFKVVLVIEGAYIVNGEIYSSRDGLMLVKEKGIPLFAIYCDRATKRLKLSCRDYDLMSWKEKRFHDSMNVLLQGI